MAVNQNNHQQLESNHQTKCGFIGIVGRPNAGKSTFLNAILNNKLAAVSLKPQTTRHRILGISHQKNTQLLFLDSPGLHRHAKKLPLNTFLNKEAWTVVEESDVLCYLIDINRGWSPYDEKLLDQILKQFAGPIFVLISQCDKLKKSERGPQSRKIYQNYQSLVTTHGYPHPVTCFQISAKQSSSIEEVINKLIPLMPDGPFLYPSHQITDRDNSFIVEEMLREQIYRCLGQELPYQSTVSVDSIAEKSHLIHIQGKIIVSHLSQRGMFIGRNGSKIKEIGTKTRIRLEDFWQKKVHLQLQVRLEKNWHEDKEKTRELGLYTSFS